MRRLLMSALAAGLVTVGLATAPPAGADHIDEYVAYSSGNQEVPRSGEDGWAWSVFRVYEDRIEYSSTAFDVDDVEAVHLHGAPRGENGPVVVSLVDDIVDDTRVAGTITPDEIDGMSVDELVQAMATEQIYINFHTPELPDGAIRGQVVASPTFEAAPPAPDTFGLTLGALPHDPAADGGSDPSGSVEMTVDGNMLTVELEASGLAPGLPHAQHLHGALEGGNVCPVATDDTDGNGLIDTTEGVPSYGGIQASLTTEGDTSADSALAVDRFPVADEDGNLSYTRTFEVSDEVADAVGHLHVVVHGIDVNGDGGYDAGAGASPLDPALPLEATVPALCGA
ncbi:MAG: CHRD domain-containing protein [Actinomycetota bacterium]|nr:CHRD domain-containing protein [Actinomycetota bacterium]